MVMVYFRRSYSAMKNLSNLSCKIVYCLLISAPILSQEPFLEIRPYAPPSFQQYPITEQVDHHYPYAEDGSLLRFDGLQFTDNIIYPNCVFGLSCYDGHGGIDYHMPYNNPIIAPANGYVLWASFSEPADPCPGGITPNGDQGTIIISHGDGYYTVYLHMNPPLGVSVGENVETGDTLGYNGNTGCAVNAHLHFEVRKGNWTFDINEPHVVDPFGWWGTIPDPIEEIRGNRSEWLWVSNSLVDDGDNGFQRFAGPDWNYLSSGYNNDCWITPVKYSIEESRHYAIWVPYLQDSGEYNIEIFTPEGVNASTGAIYEISVKNEDGTSTKTNVIVNQNSSPGGFTAIATLELPAGSKSSVILRDVVQQSSSGNNVVFDAIRFTSNTSTSVLDKRSSNILADSEDVFSYPNPFNPTTTVVYRVQKQSDVEIIIYNSIGAVIKSYLVPNQQPGLHNMKWGGYNNDGSKVNSGIYFFIIKTQTRKMSGKTIFIK